MLMILVFASLWLWSSNGNIVRALVTLPGFIILFFVYVIFWNK